MSAPTPVGAGRRSSAFSLITLRFRDRRTALSYALVGSRWCSSCCTPVVRDSSRVTPHARLRWCVGVVLARCCQRPVRPRRRIRGGWAPGGPRRRTRQRVRDGRRAPEILAKGRHAHVVGMLGLGDRHRHHRCVTSKTARELGLADRLTKTKIEQPELLEIIGTQTGETLRIPNWAKA